MSPTGWIGLIVYQRGLRWHKPAASHRQNLAPARTTAGQHVATVLGLHPSAETVNLVALALFRLVRTKHLYNSFVGPCKAKCTACTLYEKK